jgi:hypothetical protein
MIGWLGREGHSLTPAIGMLSLEKPTQNGSKKCNLKKTNA